MNNNPNFDFYRFSAPQEEQQPAAEPMPAEVAPAAPAPQPDKTAIRRARRSYSRLGWAFVLMIVAWQVGGILLSVLVPTLFPQISRYMSEEVFNTLVGTLPLYVFGVPAMLLCLIGMPRQKPLIGAEPRFGFGSFLVALLILPCLAIGGNLIGQTIMGVMETVFQVSFENSVETVTSIPLLLMVILVVVIGPIFEELICRKLLIDRLLVFGELPAILVSAVLFGLLHMNLYQFFYAALLGAVLAYAYIRSGRFIVPAALHILFNFLFGFVPTVLMQYVPVEELLTIMETEDVDLLMTFYTENLLPLLGYVLFVFLQYSLAIVGLVLLIAFRKKIKLKEQPCQLPRGRRMGVAFGNSGIIAAMVLCIGLWALTVVLTILMS